MAEPFLCRDPNHELSSSPPKGWALCNGQLLPINQNQALFSLLGTTFGGDGRVNFALPDLRGRVADPCRQRPHAGRDGRRAGAHAVHCRAADAHARRSMDRSANGNDRRRGRQCARDVAGRTMSTIAPANLVAMTPATVANVGGSQAHLNMQPFLMLNFCIALQGIFPSQT